MFLESIKKFSHIKKFYERQENIIFAGKFLIIFPLLLIPVLFFSHYLHGILINFIDNLCFRIEFDDTKIKKEIKFQH